VNRHQFHLEIRIDIKIISLYVNRHTILESSEIPLLSHERVSNLVQLFCVQKTVKHVEKGSFKGEFIHNYAKVSLICFTNLKINLFSHPDNF